MTESRTLDARPADATRLGKAIAPLFQAHPGASGVVALREGRDAFAARFRLAEHAERTLDVQYYLWHDDLSGTLLLDALRRAADRGVRVRLLLDDNNTAGLDTVLAAVNAHPGIELRLFNPFRHRRLRAFDYVTDFTRLNHRMHNKSFTVDGCATIVGGRNVGDEYFGAGKDLMFVDLDVLAIGPVVGDVVRDFDRYWTCDSAQSADGLLPAIDSPTRSRVEAAADRLEQSAAAQSYEDAVASSPFVRDMLDGRLAFEWAAVTLVSDEPSKIAGRVRENQLLWPRLQALVGAPRRQLDLVSPYFVPGAPGVARLAELARAGVRITVLTNSLEATDVAPVHAGYAKRRRALLEAGVALFEMKRAGPTAKGRRLAGSSASSLHAKTFGVDRDKAFVGSFNFDPRSARLNTESGFVIESPALACAVADAFIERVPERAYEVRLNNGRMQWLERIGDKEIVHDTEPGTTFPLRLGVWLLSKLPIEWLL